MRRKRFCFLLSLAFSSTAFGQNPLFEDDFNDNKNGWRLQHDSDFLVEIKKGALHLEKLEKNVNRRGCLWYNQPIPGFNTLKDFSVAFYAKFLRGGDVGEMIDLQWGGEKSLEDGRIASALYQLTLWFTGKIWIDRFDKRWSDVIRTETPPDWTEGFNRNEWNKYEVEQKDSTLIFRVNDRELLRQAYKPIAGNSIGFQQCLKSAWEIDRIVIRQDPLPNVVVESGKL